MRICIRVDDFGWTNEESDRPPIKKPDSDLALAQRFHEAMGGLPYLGAVIPAVLSDAGRQWLRSKPEELTVAAHGWDHGAETPDCPDEFHRFSEVNDFVCRLQDAQDILQTEHFVPPYNAISPTLLLACQQAGFKYIWTGPSNGPPWPIQVGIVWLVPAYSMMYGAANRIAGQAFQPLAEYVSDIAPFFKSQDFVLTLHLPWEASFDKTFDGVCKLVDVVRPYAVSPKAFMEPYL